jgi:hypothetical protein
MGSVGSFAWCGAGFISGFSFYGLWSSPSNFSPARIHTCSDPISPQKKHGIALQTADLAAYEHGAGFGKRDGRARALFHLYFLCCILSFLFFRLPHFLSLFHNFHFLSL